MSGLPPGSVLDAASAPVSLEPLPASEVVHGEPRAGVLSVFDLADGIEVGIWEMTPGTASDTEADEVFVVLSGRASVAFVDPPLPDIEIGPGSLVRLTEGMRTVWTVTETLRKIYIA